ncbi:Uncharacterised protein [Fusobacterium necrophorum subsp. necrophorum]|nr:Uncharacterised protein [Fusobacterium necrophorum subsp. necrophorum]
MKKKKEVMALFFLVTALIGTSCSSGGGGHGGSGPGVDSVPIGSVRDKKGGITKPDVKMGFPVVKQSRINSISNTQYAYNTKSKYCIGTSSNTINYYYGS